MGSSTVSSPAAGFPCDGLTKHGQLGECRLIPFHAGAGQARKKRPRRGLRAGSQKLPELRRSGRIVAEASGGDGKKQVQNRPRWHFLAGSAVAAGCAAATGVRRLHSSCGHNGGNAGDGGGGNGGGSSGGGEGSAGGNGYETGMATKNRNEEKKPRQTAGLHGLASLSSSAQASDSIGVKPAARNAHLAKVIAGSLGSGQVESTDTVKEFKGKAEIDFETMKLNLEIEPVGFEKSKLSAETETQKASPSAENVEFKNTNEDGPTGGRHQANVSSWLASLVDSVFSNAKQSQMLGEPERKRLAAEVAAAVIEQLGNDIGLARKYEIGYLKRLQQEAFFDIMKARERLDKLDLSLPHMKKLADSLGIARTRLKGKVAAAGAFVLMQDMSCHSSRDALDQVGLPGGLEMELAFETPFREHDKLTTKCIAGHTSSDQGSIGGPFQLSKVAYEAEIIEDVKVSFVPLGAEAKDVIEIVNPLQDEAITRFASSGPTLFSHCRGSALGVGYESLKTMLSVSGYLSGWGDSTGPLCLSTLMHFIHHPCERLIISASGLNRFWPCPPLPSSPGLHWSEMKPFVLSKTTRSKGTTSSNLQLSHPAEAFQAKGTSMQTWAVSGAVDLGWKLSMGGWVQAERGDWLEDDEKRRLQWAVSLAKTTRASVDWGVTVGSSRPDVWSGVMKDQELSGREGSSSGSQPLLQLEAFVKYDSGNGFVVRPGLIYLLSKQCQMPAVMLTAEWEL